MTANLLQDSFVSATAASERWCVHKDLAHLLVPVSDLIPDPANARLHSQKNLSTIGSSVGRFGQRTPLVVQKKGDQLIVRKGNGTLEAARSMGWTHVAALQVVEGDLEATAYAIADNRAGELAHWDDDVDEDVFYGGMVLLKDIEFYSLCEHHMLPFVGTASVGYIPGASGRVVGISKLARLVDCYARRLQCQERLTSQVADALEKHLECSGAIVVIKAEHFCMKMRGVGKQASEMITSEVRGILKDNAAARAEALRLI